MFVFQRFVPAGLCWLLPCGIVECVPLAHKIVVRSRSLIRFKFDFCVFFGKITSLDGIEVYWVLRGVPESLFLCGISSHFKQLISEGLQNSVIFILSTFISWNLSIEKFHSFLLFDYAVILFERTFEVYPLPP